MIRASAILVLALICHPAAARAQYSRGSNAGAGRVELGVAAAWVGGHTSGTSSATETSNPGVSDAPLTLFNTDVRAKPALGVEGRVGVYLSPRVAIEGTAAFSRPVLAIHLSGDFEGAADTIASETLTEYVIGGSLLYHFGSGRVVPFVLGGAAYLRQLHDDAAVLQTGTELHAGGGIKCWFGSGRRRSGLRVDAQVSARDRSAGFADKRIALPVVTAGMAFQF